MTDVARQSAETIRSLKPNVSREEALRHFTRGARGAAASLVKGRAHSIAELYLPYRLFEVAVANGNRTQKRIFALDSVEGVLDLFEFREVPGAPDVLTIRTRNALPCLLAEDRARAQLIDKVRRVIFSQGFARLRDFKLEALAISGLLYMPYWICFRGDDDALRFEVLDAIQYRAEGAKLRKLVENWLRTSPHAGAESNF
jgi:hypothetical protein